MKIQLASDLHLEFLQKDFPGERLITPAPGADVLVLAGDIANGTEAFTSFADWPVPILYVAGNHEFYGHDLGYQLAKFRLVVGSGETASRIRFLENDRVDLGGVRFLGTTLWTDYRLHSVANRMDAMSLAQQALNDHQVIRFGRTRFRTRDALARHERARAWLAGELATPFAGPTVVITHHGPHPLSVHAQYEGDLLSAAYVSDLGALMPGVDLWLHGHGHDSFDYRVGACRVVANPAGYISNRRRALPADFDFENPLFDPALVLALGDAGPSPVVPTHDRVAVKGGDCDE